MFHSFNKSLKIHDISFFFFFIGQTAADRKQSDKAGSTDYTFVYKYLIVSVYNFKGDFFIPFIKTINRKKI